jgi:hypothetical protein
LSCGWKLTLIWAAHNVPFRKIDTALPHIPILERLCLLQKLKIGRIVVNSDQNYKKDWCSCTQGKLIPVLDYANISICYWALSSVGTCPLKVKQGFDTWNYHYCYYYYCYYTPVVLYIYEIWPHTARKKNTDSECAKRELKGGNPSHREKSTR